MIKTNPFTSTTFISYWSKHFLAGKKTHAFRFIPNLLFYKSKCPGLYINAGKNLTKGIDYEVKPIFEKEAKGKTFLIYDVIDFTDNEMFLKNGSAGLYSVRQYPGFLIELEAHSTFNDFITKTFKKSSRYKLRKYKKRLEECFDISFRVYSGEMLKDEYDNIFKRFRQLLEKRFEEKKITNNNLDSQEWNFYKDVVHPMILEKKAALFVLYNNNEAISITLAYLSEDRIFDAITVFDIDYAKFHLGSIKIMYLIDWCIENGWKTLDFSKGYFEYKTRWSNKQFHLNYHILFDKRSLRSQVLSITLKYFFTFKQFLRERRLNESLHKLKYALKNKKTESSEYSFLEWNDKHSYKDMLSLDIYKVEYAFLKRICYDFLYLHQEQEKDLKVYKVDKTEGLFLLVGQNKKTGLKLIV